MSRLPGPSIEDHLVSMAARGSLGIGKVCLFQAPADLLEARVQQGQIAALVRMAPLTIAVNFLAAMIMTASLWPDLPRQQLLAWLGTISLFCLVRMVRLVRLKRDPGYLSRKPPTLRTVVTPILLISVLWAVPVLLWFDHVPPRDQVVMILVLFGLASGASVTLSTVPPAAFAYLSALTVAGIVTMSKLNPVTIPPLVILFTLLLVYAVVCNARQFAGHLAARLELEEQVELVALLREFDASGSEWLWELDADLRITRMSPAMIREMRRKPDEVIGAHAFALLDPFDRVVDVSASMRTIMDHLTNSQTFRDLAIPVRAGAAWWSLSGKPVHDAEGRLTGWRGVGSDITALRHRGSDSVTLARHDPLTGLANRLLIRELLEEAMLLQQSGRGSCALLLVDLDRFKLVNDTLGHGIGDDLLCEVAKRLEATAGGAQVGRLGGDEFAVVVTSAEDREALAVRAEAIIAALSMPYRIGFADLNIGATIGIATSPSDGATQEDLTRSADLALYSAKRAGRGSFRFFSAQMAAEAAADRALESDLRSALKQGEFSLAYQPIVHSRTHDVIAREALLRWRHPTRGEVSPELFVPVVEDAGLIGQIGNWVLREACREAAGWADLARVAVNVSSAQLAAGPVLVANVVQALAASELPPERLEIELTESIFLADDSTTRNTLEQLRAIGVRLVLDDFGMGYSSYACLTTAEFSKLKIDRAFTVAAAGDTRNAERAIVESILTLARGLGVEVTAEGIETPEQAEAMTRLGCGQLQGFLFGRPAIPVSSRAPARDPLPLAATRRRPHAA